MLYNLANHRVVLYSNPKLCNYGSFPHCFVRTQTVALFVKCTHSHTDTRTYIHVHTQSESLLGSSLDEAFAAYTKTSVLTHTYIFTLLTRTHAV